MNRPTIHGYPLPEGTLPDRPEWRLTTRHFDHERCVIVEAKAWERADGARLFHFDPWSREQLLAALDEYDREHPHEPPPWRVGQVWALSSQAAMVTEVGPDHVAMGPMILDLRAGPLLDGAWPPHGHALVAGPGSPWLPPWGAP